MKKIDELKQKIKEKTEQINVLKNKMMDELRVEFHGSLVEMFDEYPFVTAVHFTAYTPFFNDGSECTFSSHHDYCGFNGYDDDGSDGKSKYVQDAFGDIEGENILRDSLETIYVETPNPDYDPTKSYYGNYKTKSVKQLNPNFNALHKKAVEDFRSALNAVSEENWKELVGDHCIVMIDRKGIHVEEYNHE